MSDCQSINLLVTPLVDGELAGPERERIERHLRFCAPCHSRVQAERAVRALIHGRQPAFKGECAPVALRVKCAGHCALGMAAGRRWRKVVPWAAAAAMVLGVGGVFLYQATSPSARVMAAALADDHERCFAASDAPAARSAAAVDAAMVELYGWQAALPDAARAADLELVGSRRCSYGGGEVAHIMYRHHGQPMSLFMLPKAAYDREVLDAHGETCAIWSNGERTFVLVSREGRDEVERVAARVQPTIH